MKRQKDLKNMGDGSIEAALKGLDVEVWNWKKMDISIATIRNAAPNARKACLYSSGNNAVLQGWSDRTLHDVAIETEETAKGFRRDHHDLVKGGRYFRFSVGLDTAVYVELMGCIRLVAWPL